MTKTEEVGFVESVKGKIAFVNGLPTVRVGDIVEGENKASGYVAALFPDFAEVYLLSGANVGPGEMFRKKKEQLGISLQKDLVGRVIDPLGNFLDGKTMVRVKAAKEPLDQPAVGISGRKFIDAQFDTGIMVVDTLFPLGKGQRELVIGESRSGKTAFLLDLIANQTGRGVVCIFALIGKPVAEARGVWKQIADRGLFEHTILIMSTSADSQPLIFLTPQTALTVADFFRRQGRDVLLILDDMGVHARSYRELSLISGRPPGRESYPGDIFYQQAKLLERAGNFNLAAGGGSITALPVIELTLSDFQAFIPTNLMGMTDGHLLFRSDLAQKEQIPAIDLTLSVTRVGSQTQKRIQNALAMKVKETLATGAQLEIVSRFGSELPLATRQILVAKAQLEEILGHKVAKFIPKEVQVLLLALPFTSYLRGRDRGFVKNYLEKLVDLFLTDKDLVALSQGIFKKENLAEVFAALEGVKEKLVAITTS